jgi:hypothetical protein
VLNELNYYYEVCAKIEVCQGYLKYVQYERIAFLKKKRIYFSNDRIVVSIPIQFRPRTIAVNDGGMVRKSTHE